MNSRFRVQFPSDPIIYNKMYTKQQIIDKAKEVLQTSYGMNRPVREAQLKFVKFPINNKDEFYSAVSLLVDDTIFPAYSDYE